MEKSKNTNDRVSEGSQIIGDKKIDEYLWSKDIKFELQLESKSNKVENYY